MITTLTGKNIFQVHEARKHITSDFVVKHGEFSIEVFDTDIEDIRVLHTALNTVPFLVDQKLVILNNPSESKEMTEKLQAWLEQKSVSVEVLVVDPTIDKRTSWFKFLQKNTDFNVFEPIDEFSLKKWVRLRVEERGSTIDESAVTLLIRSAGFDQMSLSMEIDKLCDYTDKITSAIVAELVEPTFEDTVFNLLEALFRGEGKTSYKLLNELKSRKTDSFEVISMIGWQVSILITIVANRSMPVDQLSKQSKIHPYVLQKNMPLARKLSIQNTKQLLEYVVQAELSIKKDSEKPERALDVLMAQVLVAVDE